MRTARRIVLRTAAATLLAISAPLVLCSCSPENVVQSRLSKLLGSHGYTLYTPMRGDDYPGTMFVLSRNQEGWWTEFKVAGYKEAFSGAATFDPAGQPIEFADQLTETFSFSGNLGFEIFTAFVNAQLAHDYTRSMKITLKDPKIAHTMTTTRLAQLRDKLSDGTKADLKFRKEMGQLENVYIVMETIRIEGFDISLTLKNKFKGTIGVEKIRDLTSLDAAVDTDSDADFRLSSDEPMLIGYKTMPIPDTILRDQIAPLKAYALEGLIVDAETINTIKSK